MLLRLLRLTSPEHTQDEADIRLLETAVDGEFYLRRYPDVELSLWSPAEHYFHEGWRKGYDPNSDFSTSKYLRANPDVQQADVNPLVHYLRFGRGENRRAFEADKIEQKLAGVLAPTDWALVLDQTGIDFTQINKRQEPEKFRPASSQAAVSRGDLLGAEADEDLLPYLTEKAAGKILSLDIWDTLLRRDCHPDEVKLRSARLLWLSARQQKKLIRDLHPCDLYQVRQMAEALVANEHYEYKFAVAAHKWLGLLGLDDDALLDHLIQGEVQIEKNATATDRTIMQLMKAHSGRIICISDFYLPSSSLKEIIGSHGANVDEVYCSADFGKSKRSGFLFGEVLRLERLEPKSMLHIGDREDSDFESPKRYGIEAIIYQDVLQQQIAKVEAERLHEHLSGNISPHCQAILQDFERAGYSSVATAALSVVSCGLAMHVVERALELGIDKVHFCTREGAFFKKVYDSLQEGDIFDLGKYPKSELLHVSRVATFSPSLRSVSLDEMMRLWNQYSSQSMRAFSVSLNISHAEIEPFLQSVDIDPDEIITYPWLDLRIKKLFADKRFVAMVSAVVRRHREELARYLHTVDFDLKDTRPKLLVDIGWRGTIQDNLNRLSSGPVHGVYLGLDRFLNKQSETATKEAYLFDRNLSGDFNISDVACLEFVFNSPGGSVVGYAAGSPKTNVVAGEEAVVVGTVAEIQKRVMEALPIVAQYCKRHGLVSRDLLPLSRQLIGEYVTNPPNDIANAFASLVHNESFGGGTNDEMDEGRDLLLSAFDATGSDLHGKLVESRRKLRWIEAHLRTAPFVRKVADLADAQRLQLPTAIFAPAILRGSSVGRPTIAIAAPAPITGSGGHRTIYNLAKRLSACGADVHLMSEFRGSTEAQNWVDDVLSGANITQHSMWYAGLSAAAAVATVDYSAFYISEFYAHKSKTFYFVQDYEAQFNPLSGRYLRSEDSYTKLENHISVGNWLGHVLYNQFEVSVATGGLGIDTSRYWRDPNVEKNEMQVAALFQADKPRRAPDLCIKALEIVKQKNPRAKIVLYGSNYETPPDLEAMNLGLITDLNELRALYNKSSVGLCISSTNPSRIPFEMMACGCVPVDLYRYNNLFDYDPQTALLAYQSPESVAGAILHLLEDQEKLRAYASAGANYMKYRSLEWECDVGVNAIEFGLGDGGFNGLGSPKPIYKSEPFVADDTQSGRVFNFLRYQKRQAGL